MTESVQHWKGMTLRDQLNEWRERALEAETERDHLEAALKQASECCARPRGVCFPAQDLGDGRVGQAGSLGDGS
jgi:hypothetical protein